MKQTFTRHKGARQRGAALALVLIFMTVMLILGTAMLAGAQYSVAQSRSAAAAEKHYYAAESAAQIAAQMLLENLGGAVSIVRDEIAPEAVGVTLDAMEAELEDTLLGAYNDVKRAIDGMAFNGEPVSLGELDTNELVIQRESETYDIYDDINEEFITVCIAAVYFENPALAITATSGGRSVTVSTNAEANLTLTVIRGGTHEVTYGEYYGSAFYKDTTGGIYGPATDEQAAANKESYDMFVSGLNELFADAASLTVNSVLNTTDNEHESWPALAAGTANASFAGTTINASTPGVGTVEYLYVPGNLTISGNVSFPNLKGIYVGGNLIVNTGASFTGNTNKAIGTNCLIGGAMTINAEGGNTTINNSRFYVEGNIEAKLKNSSLISNSIFIAYGDAGTITLNVPTQPNVNVGSTTHTPQFYAKYLLRMGAQGSGNNYYGIYATLGQTDMVKDGSTSGISFSGLIIGNVDNSRISKSMTELNETQKNNMMDGGIFSVINESDTIIIREPDEAYETFSYASTGVTIRETTGEG